MSHFLLQETFYPGTSKLKIYFHVDIAENPENKIQ